MQQGYSLPLFHPFPLFQVKVLLFRKPNPGGYQPSLPSDTTLLPVEKSVEKILDISLCRGLYNASQFYPLMYNSDPLSLRRMLWEPGCGCRRKQRHLPYLERSKHCEVDKRPTDVYIRRPFVFAGRPTNSNQMAYYADISFYCVEGLWKNKKK